MKNLKTPFRTIFIFLVILTLPFSISSVYAQSAADRYPNQGIEIICGWGTGGDSDTLTRKVSQILSEYMKVPVHVTNAPGVAGLVGMAKLDSARADGYTIGYLTHSGLLRMILDPKQKSFREFQALCTLQLSLSQLYVRSDAPWKTFGELLAEAKKREITTCVSSPKGGDEYHIAYINLKMGTKFVPVPYAKPTERFAAQLGGHVDLQVEQYGSMQPFMAEKKIRPILHFGPERDKRFPDVESSFEYNLPVSLPIFRGFLMKKGTNQIIMQKLEKAFRNVYDHPEMRALNEKNKVDTDSWYGREAFTKLMEETWNTAAPVIKELGWTAKK